LSAGEDGHLSEKKAQAERCSDSDKKWPILFRSIEQAMERRDYYGAEKLALFALELMEEHDDSDSRLIQTLQMLSRIYYASERYGMGAPVLKRLIKIYSRLTGEASMETSTIMQNAALLYHYWGKREEAEYYYQKAIEAKTTLLGQQDQQVLRLISHYVKFLEDSGRPQDAAYYRELCSKSSKELMTRTGSWEAMVPQETLAPENT